MTALRRLPRAVLGALALIAMAMGALAAPGLSRATTTPPVMAGVQPPRQILVMLKLTADHFRPNEVYGGGGYGDAQTQEARRRMAQQIARRHGLSLVGDGWPMPLVGLDCYVMAVPDGQPVETVIAEVQRDPLVAWSQPMQTFQARGGQSRSGPVHEAADRGDPLFAVQPAAKIWRLAELHKVATGRGVLIAVVDSKVEVNHPDLSGQVADDEDFVSKPGPVGRSEHHGTGVAGVIAAKEGNGVGIAGIAPHARLLALRACWESESAPAGPTVCDTLSLAKAIHYAVDHNANIINLSLAGPPDLLLKKLLDVASARHISVVAAYDAALPKGGFPASYPGVIAVAIDTLPSFPPGVYGAPGEDIPTTEPGGRWDLVNGSSFAAAHISGLIALARELHSGGDPHTQLVSTRAAGGRVDACATILRPAGACDCSCGVGAPTVQSTR